MKRISLSSILVVSILSAPYIANAQQEKRWLKHHISLLTTPSMLGRGYVNKGHDRAAKYVLKHFKEYGLLPVNKDSTYIQTYSFAVNTFPDEVSLKLNKKQLVPGADFLIDAASISFNTDKIKVSSVDLNKIKDTAVWNKTKAAWHTDSKAYFLKNTDSLCKHLAINERRFAKQLPKGCFLIPQHGKITWTVATDTIPATVFYVEDTVLPRRVRKAAVHVNAVYLPAAKNKNENIIACVPGEVRDSFIVFTAHYDHLGAMGKGTYFPGASDNASGTAMLLYLANYFAKNPQRYTMVFIAFSGEEAGLLGSSYFVNHPMIPLDHIRFLTNLDIMGDATDGITVVNATEFSKQFDALRRINNSKDYLPQIKSRGKAANSDHYHFTEAGVPSFFIYTNGGKGFYHDIFDTAASLPMTNIDKLAKLLVAFAKELNVP